MMDVGGSAKIYRCRRCRFVLFKDEDLSDEHELVDDCSLFYLSSTNLMTWVKEAVDEVGWTRGKLYCPQCEARLGAFSFLHFIMCQCNQETMPAIYCVRSKIDEMITVPDDTNLNLMANSSYEVLDDAHGNFSNVLLNESIRNPSVLIDEACGSSDVFLGNDVNAFLGDTSRAVSNDFCRGSGISMDDMVITTSKSMVSDEVNYDPALENVLTRIIVNDVLGFADDSFDGGEVFTKEMEKQIMKHPYAGDSTDNEMSVFRRRNASVTIHRNSCFDPDVLPAYPEVYDEAEFSSKLQENCQEDTKCVKKVFYTSHSHSPHLSCCRRCQLLHEQLLRRSKDHQRAAQSDSSHQDDGVTESDLSGSDESVIYAEMKDVKRRLRDLQGYLRDENTGPVTSRNLRRGSRRRRRVKSNLTVRSSRVKATYDKRKDESSDLKAEKVEQEKVEEEPTEQHQCPVCLDILYEPYKTACSHIFCAPCLRQIHKISRRKPVCPLCRHRIYQVFSLKGLQEEIELLYPELYRKRLQIEMQRPINNFQLPNPSNVRFDPDLDSDTRLSMQHIFRVLRACLMIFVMVLTYLINSNVAERGVHQRYASWVRYAILALIGVGFAYLFFMLGSWFSLYAVDVSLFAITLCLCYFFIAKIMFDIYRDGQNIAT